MTDESKTLAAEIATLVRKSPATHDDKFLALAAVIAALGVPK